MQLITKDMNVKSTFLHYMYLLAGAEIFHFWFMGCPNTPRLTHKNVDASSRRFCFLLRHMDESLIMKSASKWCAQRYRKFIQHPPSYCLTCPEINSYPGRTLAIYLQFRSHVSPFHVF